MEADTLVSLVSLVGNSRICWALGSNPSDTSDTIARARAVQALIRTSERSISEPHGPRLASSRSCKWLSRLARSSKCLHFNWLMQDAIGTIMADLPTVVNTAIKEFG